MFDFRIFLLVVLHLFEFVLGDETPEVCEIQYSYEPKEIKLLYFNYHLPVSVAASLATAFRINKCSIDEVFSPEENSCIPSLSFVEPAKLTLSSLLGKTSPKVSHTVELETIKKIDEVLQSQMEGARSRILHTAVVLNSTDTVRYLLQNKSDIEERDDFGQTALHVACVERNEEIVKILVEEGHADVNARNLNNQTALHIATEIGSLSIVKYLFEKGGHMFAKDLVGNNLLHVAAKRGWTHFFEFFLSPKLFDDKEADYINVQNAMNETYILLATVHERPLIVKLLSEKGADLFVKDEFGFTVLDVAVMKYDIEIVEFLLMSPHFNKSKNVDGNIQSALTIPLDDTNADIINLLFKTWVDFGTQFESLRIYMIYAINNNLLDFVDIITSQSSLKDINEEIDETTYLHLAVSRGHLPIVRLLIERGADVLSKDVNGNIPIHIAAAQNELEIVKFLLEKNEETLEIKDNHNRDTPMMASLFHSSATLEFLLTKQKHEVVVQDGDGMTVFHYACFTDYQNYADDPTLIRLLLDKFNQTDLQDKYGRTPLHWCSTVEKLETFKLLLSRTSNAEIKDKCGRTPLHLGIESTIELLLSTGRNINERDFMGRTPLHLASDSYNSHRKIIILIENGAKVNEKDLMGRTPLHLASQRCDSNRIEILIENGAKVNARDNEGNTPLHLSLIETQYYFCDSPFDALIERGANLLSVNNNGDTAQSLLDNTNEITKQKKLQDSREDLVKLNSFTILISNKSNEVNINDWNIKFIMWKDKEVCSTSLPSRPGLDDWLPGSILEWNLDSEPLEVDENNAYDNEDSVNIGVIEDANEDYVNIDGNEDSVDISYNADDNEDYVNIDGNEDSVDIDDNEDDNEDNVDISENADANEDSVDIGDNADDNEDNVNIDDGDETDFSTNTNILGNCTDFHFTKRVLPKSILMKFQGSRKGKVIKIDHVRVSFGAKHPSPRPSPVYEAFDLGSSIDTESGSELDAKLYLNQPELYCCQNLMISSKDNVPDSILGLYLYDYVRSKNGTTMYIRDSDTLTTLYKRPGENWDLGINSEETLFSFLNSSDVICPGDMEDNTVSFGSGKSATLEMICETYEVDEDGYRVIL